MEREIVNTEFFGEKKFIGRLGWVLLGGLLPVALSQAAEQRWSREHAAIVTHPASPLAITTFGGDLVVGGSFNWFDGNRARLTARSAANGVWQDGGMDFSGWINSFAVANGELYAGGSFELLDRSPSVMRWDGHSWQPLGNLSFTAHALLPANHTLYAGGGFFQSGTDFFQGVVAWDGAAWTQVGTGVPGSVYALAVYDGKLVAGGLFSQAGGNPANGLAAWDGSAWSELGGGLAREFFGGEARAFVVDGNFLYVGGAFVSAGGLPANAVACWDGSSWAALGDGLTRGSLAATVRSMARLGSDLFCGGDFTNAGGVSTSNIARWDGTQWHTLGEGLDGTVAGLTVQGSRIIAVGKFRNSGALPLPGVAAWDGASWQPLATVEPEASVTITSVERLVGEVFAAGHFTDGDRVSRSFLGRWNGAAWERFDQAGNPVSFTASTIHNGQLYLTTGRIINGAESELLKWNGSGFERIPNNLGNTIRAMASSSEGIYCIGSFAPRGGHHRGLHCWRVTK